MGAWWIIAIAFVGTWFYLRKKNKGMITIYRAENGQLFFNVKSKNGRIIVHSETYKRKAGVLKAIKALQSTLPVKDLS
jgi:uncharacterized protein YegP (UPF0339 family)